MRKQTHSDRMGSRTESASAAWAMASWNSLTARHHKHAQFGEGCSGIRVCMYATHNLWMRVTMVLKAAWTSAAEQVDTMGWACSWSNSATYCTETHMRGTQWVNGNKAGVHSVYSPSFSDFSLFMIMSGNACSLASKYALFCMTQKFLLYMWSNEDKYDSSVCVEKHTPVLATPWCWWGWCSPAGAHQKWGSGSAGHTQTSWEPLRQMRSRESETDTSLHISNKTRKEHSCSLMLHTPYDTSVSRSPVLWVASLGSTRSPCCWSCRSGPWSSVCLSWRCCEDASAACSPLYWGRDETRGAQNTWHAVQGTVQVKYTQKLIKLFIRNCWGNRLHIKTDKNLK